MSKPLLGRRPRFTSTSVPTQTFLPVPVPPSYFGVLRRDDSWFFSSPNLSLRTGRCGYDRPPVDVPLEHITRVTVPSVSTGVSRQSLLGPVLGLSPDSPRPLHVCYSDGEGLRPTLSFPRPSRPTTPIYVPPCLHQFSVTSPLVFPVLCLL